ncbi:hypothetical protein FRC11_013223 [Ceratobasidium sp. 423]|nr:hypothetical protein FRC11_013223 [Ceratobasidium sp. 423]
MDLTVRQPVLADNPGSVTLKEVVVDAGTGRSRATVIKTVLDDDDPSIAYAPSNGNWTIVNAYPQTTQPAGIKSSTFHDSYSTNATATIGFKGVGISVYGACYSHSEYAAYSASIDGAEEIQYNGTVNLYSIGGDVKQRAGNCLRYFKTGLDADKDHQLVLKVKDMGRLAVDWVEVFSVEGGQQFINGTGGQGDGSNVMSNNTRVAIIAGAVSAGVVLILALLTLIFCIRRERSRPQDILTPAPTQNGVRTQEDGSYIITPFTPERLHTQTDSHGTSAMLSRPQPQTPAPSAFDRYRTGAPVIQSYSLGDAPLASPGLLTMSSYTGSSGSGSGWPDSADYQTTAFNYTAPLSPSTSRPSYTGRVSSSSSGPGLTFVGGEPIGGGIGVSEAGSSAGLRQDPRTYAGDAAGPVSSSTSPVPPAYERIQVPGGRGRIGRVERAWTYAENGIATMTHYIMDVGTIAACGCTGGSTHYPTAALSSLAYGSDGTVGFGSSCGRCFNLTLLNTFLSSPPFYPNPAKSVVVKVTDLCPAISQWCDATEKKPNAGGTWLNFDLVWPSVAIPEDWFPSDESFYGYKDFGVWNVSYQSVSCVNSWAGGHDPAALGSVNNLGDSVCCPADPLAPNGTICPSSGPAPSTGTSGAPELVPGVGIWMAMSIVASMIIYF